MESAFKTWKTSRKLYAEFFDQYSLEQLNKTPEGFSNNLIWNIGHIVVAQQALVYKLSGLDWYITDELFNKYKPGTKPSGVVTQVEVLELKELLSAVIPKTEEDFEKGRFINFTERMTRTGFHLASLEDAIEFNNYHEALHLGCMMGIRKFV